MTGTNGQTNSSIDKRDFDANRPLLRNIDPEPEDEDGPTRSETRSERQWTSRPTSRRSRISFSDGGHQGSDDGLFSDVVEGIVERDRRKMQKELVRVCSFAWGVVSWYEDYLLGFALIDYNSFANFCFPQSRCWQYHGLLSVWPSDAYASPLLPASSQCCLDCGGDLDVPARPSVWIPL